MAFGDYWRDYALEQMRGGPIAQLMQQRANTQNQNANPAPVGGIRGPAPVMPTMPQIPTMDNLPTQGGMVDFNALASQMAGPMPDLSQFFSSPAPVMSQPSPFGGTKGPQLPSPPGKVPGQVPAQMPTMQPVPAPNFSSNLPRYKVSQLMELFGQNNGGLLDPRMGGLL